MKCSMQSVGIFIVHFRPIYEKIISSMWKLLLLVRTDLTVGVMIRPIRSVFKAV